MNQTARELLEHLNYPDPDQTIVEARQHLAGHLQRPEQRIANLMQCSKVLFLGEMHNEVGRWMSADLVSAAATAGAKVLFIEVHRHLQRDIDVFLTTGRREDLPETAGGGKEHYDFQKPYTDMLLAARAAGLHILAVDTETEHPQGRDGAMAEMMLHYLQQHDVKGVAVLGQLHLLRRPIFGDRLSAASYLRVHYGMENITTVGRAVPLREADYSVWSRVGQVAQPVVAPTQGSVFADLPATLSRQTLYGDDFDYLFFYPAPGKEI